MNTNWCGCWYTAPGNPGKQYFIQTDFSSKTTILASTSRTVLKQKFSNSKGNAVAQAHYTFPLYDGVSVVSFKCTIGQRTIVGIVKEKQQARTDYREATEKGDFAGLFEQLNEASDTFTTRLGNIPAGQEVVVEIVYLGELKQDAETDGVRFTIPTSIAPRYGFTPFATGEIPGPTVAAIAKGGIKIVVDIAVESGAVIRSIQSPSHPIALTMGRKSSQSEDIFQNNHASATLALSGRAELKHDFVLVVSAQGQDQPRALLETHPVHGRALMTTLVPKFNLPNAHPEIVFVVDRSGSMGGKMHLVVQALKVYLKSLPLSVKFNICSFGSSHSFLFGKSKPYDESSLQEALAHVQNFDANYGGTEIQAPVEATVNNRLKNSPLEIMVLTDGQVWNQNPLFEFIKNSADKEVRLFSLGIGSQASTSLVEGMARAGNGFAQFVKDGETIDKRVVRMLKAALTPHITDYSLEVQYVTTKDSIEDDFELIDSYAVEAKVPTTDRNKSQPQVISLFDQNFEESSTKSGESRYNHLPSLAIPSIIQAPHKIPPLYAFNRTTAYLLFGRDTSQKPIKSVVLRGTCSHGPLRLEIPVEDIGEGETIHQLAAKKATQELEEGRGWIAEAKGQDGNPLKEQHEGDWKRIIEREVVRIGVQYQVAGKYCSFIAVERNDKNPGEKEDIASIVSFQDQSSSSYQSNSSALFGQHISANMTFRPTGFGNNGFGSGAFGNLAVSQMQAQHHVPHQPQQLLQQESLPRGPSLFGNSANHGPPTGSFGCSGFRSAAAPTMQATGGLFGRQNQLQHTAASTRQPGSGFGFSSFVPSAAALFGGSPAPSNCQPASRSFFGTDSTESFNDNAGANRKASRPFAYPSALFATTQSHDTHKALNETHDLTNTTTEQRMHCMIGLQEFDGSWKKIEQLLRVVGISQEVYDSGLSHIHDGSVKATALALAWLEANAPAMKDVWTLIAGKARGWLVTQDGIDDAENLVESAMAAFFPGDGL